MNIGVSIFSHAMSGPCMLVFERHRSSWPPAPQPCFEAMYCPEGSLSPHGVGKCPKGFYCPFGAKLPCPVGTFCAREGHWDPMPCYPGTGRPEYRGEHDNVVNVALRPGAGSAEFRAAWADEILPKLRAFRPEIIIVSAGFDAHADDPLGGAHAGGPGLTEDDFSWCTQQLLALAERCCDGRVVSVLEGGYSPDALQRCVRAHVEALMHGSS